MYLAPATPEHLRELCVLEARCFGLGSFPLNRRAFAYHIKKRDRLWCALEGGNVVGYILIFFHKKSGRLYSLAVDPEHSGRGIGRLLLEKALDIVRQAGKTRVFLEVRRDNKQAITLYHSLGFRPIRTLKAYYPDAMDALQMELPLLEENDKFFSLGMPAV